MGKLWEPEGKYNYRSYYQKRKSPWEGLKKSGRFTRILWQTLASLVIFFLVWGIFQFEGSFVSTVQSTVRSWFTEDYDIQPVLKFFSKVGLWGDSFERAAFETVRKQEDLGPLTVPVSGQITKPFGWVVGSDNSQTFHDGIVIAAPEGAPVKAALSGVVTLIANEETLGRVVEITDERGIVCKYAHCKEILVNLNDKVSQGQVIARVGKTGKSAHPQLYFKVMNKDEPLDPAKLFMPVSSSKT